MMDVPHDPRAFRAALLEMISVPLGWLQTWHIRNELGVGTDLVVPPEQHNHPDTQTCSAKFRQKGSWVLLLTLENKGVYVEYILVILICLIPFF